ncbi:MAG: agmatine deiminase family protein [Bacteroidota bacterium]
MSTPPASRRRLPAEWEPQRFVQFTFPHPATDWKNNWEEAIHCFQEVIRLASRFQRVLLVCQDKKSVEALWTDAETDYFQLVEIPSNDSWARDHGGITVFEGEERLLLDFVFNGWGLKFPADQDNQITRRLAQQHVLDDYRLQSLGFVLEGGSLESDGKGTLLTTSQCLLSPNRNPHLSQQAIEQTLKSLLGLERILWLHNGHLMGDDTDAHIDTLARFCDEATIAYVQCTNSADPHFEPLKAMELELRQLRQSNGAPYRLVPLPLPTPIRAEDGHRLPATYANFLLLNGAVLVPVYGVAEDQLAMNCLQSLFPGREVLAVNCRALIEQHGSLHCISMNYY